MSASRPLVAVTLGAIALMGQRKIARLPRAGRFPSNPCAGYSGKDQQHCRMRRTTGGEKGMAIARNPSSIHTHKLTEQLASFCVTTPVEALPVAALESGRQLILDTIGVALLASTHKIGRLISAQAAELGGYAQQASVFGAGNLKVAPVFAALANGTMANALDYDAGGHLPTHILPAILAVAEEGRLSGRDAPAAFV